MKTFRIISGLFLFIFLFSNNSISQNNDSIYYLFNLSIEELQNIIVISASKKEEPVQQAPATISVITAEQIKERGYESIDDALKDLPGIDFVNVHGTFPIIWAQRGSYGDENKRTLLLIDGIIENNLAEGNVLAGPQYSLHNVEQIEVIWGPSSALYGANAFSGIINIITKKGRSINGVEYQKGFGSYNSQYDKFNIGKNQNDYEFSLSGSLYNTDGPVFTERHPSYNNSYIKNAYSIIGRLRYKDITIGFNRFDRPMGIGQFSNTPEYYNLPAYGYENSEGTTYGGAQTTANGEKPGLWHSNTQTLFARFLKEFNSNLSLKIETYYRVTEIDDDSYEYDYLGNNKFRRDVYNHNSNSIGSELQADYHLYKNHDITLGFQFEQSNIERGYRKSVVMSDNDDYTIMRLLDDNYRLYNIYNNYAGFMQYRLNTSLFNATNFILGVRYDYNDVYGKTLNPRVGFVSNINEKLNIKGLYGSAYRAPTSFELFTETTVRVENPYLKPEKINTSELSLGYKITKDILLESNFFYNQFSDIIISNVPVGDVNGDGIYNYQNQNKGSAEIYGFEIRTNAILFKNISIYANYSYQDATQTDSLTNPVPNVSKHKGNIGITFPIHNFIKIHFSENIVGDRTTSPTNPDKNIDGYYISNLTLTTNNIFKNKVLVSVTIKNLFDSKYNDPGIRAATGEYYGTRHIQPGRSAFIKLTLLL
ncbi:MAG: hypothetical protein A2041_12070 [Bacteroidetes bacterium GWA2_31_9b]|nr:MAG: hypothetical protein A2041_12070 [Bacteroidetes bacterium GWA2_31_9b]